MRPRVSPDRAPSARYARVSAHAPGSGVRPYSHYARAARVLELRTGRTLARGVSRAWVVGGETRPVGTRLTPGNPGKATPSSGVCF